MEPIKNSVKYIGRRCRLIGDKVQVFKVEEGALGMKIFMRFPNTSIIMIWDTPELDADVQVGDWLTLYTEVAANAKPEPTPKQ